MPLPDIPKRRFEALVYYARHPADRRFATEVRWLADDREFVLVVILVDTDGEYSAQLLARDLKQRFRSLGSTGFFETADGAPRMPLSARLRRSSPISLIGASKVTSAVWR